MKTYIFSIIVFAALFFPNAFYPQTFTTTPFITLPGNNSQVDVLYRNPYSKISFICWVNQRDSLYTLYLRQTNPDSVKNIVIFSDTSPIANPNIAFAYNNSDTTVRIAWQLYKNNHWQILLREFSNNSLSGVSSITDSLTDNITPGLNEDSIIWIQNGNLIYKSLAIGNPNPYIIDSIGCSNPSYAKFSILAKSIDLYTPFFVVYDSDSLKNNKEIIAIYWMHDQNGKKDIWVAYTRYNPNFGAVSDPGIKPNNFVLSQNYPNPFNPSTTLNYSLPESGLVTLKIYDILGREIKTLVEEIKPAGNYSVQFGGQNLTSGIYFYQLRSGNFISTRKMVLIK